MAYDFDTVIERRGTGSLKWDRYPDPAILPMWVADMDFAAPPPVLEALQRHIDHGVLGYTNATPEVVQTVLQYLTEKHRWDVDPSWIVWLPGLVVGLNLACRAAGEPGDTVMTTPPIYPPFLEAPSLSGRQLLKVSLRLDTAAPPPAASPPARTGNPRHEEHQGTGRWQPDLEAMEKAVTPTTRLLMVCNPHNPVGRVYTRRELEGIADFCLRHNLILCVDEIFCDLRLDRVEHIPAATLSREVADRTITLLSPSKTYNLAGMSCAFAIIPNPALRKRVEGIKRGIVSDVNALGFTACMAAYRHGGAWHEELLSYLRRNRDTVESSVRDQMPVLSMPHVEATYLAWLDARRTGIADPAGFFRQAGVALSNGKDFGLEGYVRLNFGCPRSLLLEGLERMRRALATRG